MRNAFVNIHPTLQGSSSKSRVAVNPGTLILMRLRHVLGRSPFPLPSLSPIPLGRSSTSQKAEEFGGVYNAKCIQNLGLFTIPRHPPTRSFSLCVSVTPPLSLSLSPSFSPLPLSLFLSLRSDRYVYTSRYILWSAEFQDLWSL